MLSAPCCFPGLGTALRQLSWRWREGGERTMLLWGACASLGILARYSLPHASPFLPSFPQPTGHLLVGREHHGTSASLGSPRLFDCVRALHCCGYRPAAAPSRLRRTCRAEQAAGAWGSRADASERCRGVVYRCGSAGCGAQHHSYQPSPSPAILYGSPRLRFFFGKDAVSLPALAGIHVKNDSPVLPPLFLPVFRLRRLTHVASLDASTVGGDRVVSNPRLRALLLDDIGAGSGSGPSGASGSDSASGSVGGTGSAPSQTATQCDPAKSTCSAAASRILPDAASAPSLPSLRPLPQLPSAPLPPPPLPLPPPPSLPAPSAADLSSQQPVRRQWRSGGPLSTGSSGGWSAAVPLPAAAPINVPPTAVPSPPSQPGDSHHGNSRSPPSKRHGEHHHRGGSHHDTGDETASEATASTTTSGTEEADSGHTRPQRHSNHNRQRHHRRRPSRNHRHAATPHDRHHRGSSHASHSSHSRNRSRSRSHSRSGSHNSSNSTEGSRRARGEQPRRRHCQRHRTSCQAPTTSAGHENNSATGGSTETTTDEAAAQAPAIKAAPATQPDPVPASGGARGSGIQKTSPPDRGRGEALSAGDSSIDDETTGDRGDGSRDNCAAPGRSVSWRVTSTTAAPASGRPNPGTPRAATEPVSPVAAGSSGDMLIPPARVGPSPLSSAAASPGGPTDTAHDWSAATAGALAALRRLMPTQRPALPLRSTTHINGHADDGVCIGADPGDAREGSAGIGAPECRAPSIISPLEMTDGNTASRGGAGDGGGGGGFVYANRHSNTTMPLPASTVTPPPPPPLSVTSVANGASPSPDSQPLSHPSPTAASNLASSPLQVALPSLAHSSLPSPPREGVVVPAHPVPVVTLSPECVAWLTRLESVS